MKIDIITWNNISGWSLASPVIADKDNAQLIIFFGSAEFYRQQIGVDFLRDNYINAQIVGCSTGGEILGADVLDDNLVACAIEFADTEISIARASLKDGLSSQAIGEKLATDLNKNNLKHVYVVSDGTKVNGSQLIEGLFNQLPKNITVTGGLAGDGADFAKTYVTLNQQNDDQMVVAIGFYGDSIRIGYGSVGGWDAFGPERIITKSQGNILYELDNKPALQLYKSYLGDEAKDLPGSGLLYPLIIRENKESKHEIVRTIVGIDEEKQSLIFAGDINQGYISRLMKGNFNNLVDGAMQAAGKAQGKFGNENSLVLLVSCIGRKLLLGQKISDETSIIHEMFGGQVPIIGFYSYGEICHHSFTDKCDLHNQTMTVTYLTENT